MTTIAVINQKGGVGKTTTTVNLGAGLALTGRRVLLIDLDPQANLTSHLEWDESGERRSTYDLLTDQAALRDLIQETAVPGLHIVPGAADLAAAEVELSHEIGREFVLRKHLERARGEGLEYDYVLIDCPPSLGLLALNALTAADEALVPIQAEFFALAGMARFAEVQALVQERLNPRLRLTGILICMWKGQANLSHEVRDDVRKAFGDVLYETVVRQNVKLAEAPSRGMNIFDYAPDSNGAADYAAMTREFLLRHDETALDPLEALRRRGATDRPAEDRRGAGGAGGPIELEQGAGSEPAGTQGGARDSGASEGQKSESPGADKTGEERGSATGGPAPSGAMRASDGDPGRPIATGGGAP